MIRLTTFNNSWGCWVVLLAMLVGNCCLAEEATESQTNAYRELVLRDKPVGYWAFDEVHSAKLQAVGNLAGDDLVGNFAGEALPVTTGPRAPMFPLFGNTPNAALTFQAGKGWIEITDPGEASALDFDNGDAITMEAWVSPSTEAAANGLVYLIGKGRTAQSGEKAINQNFAMRLKTTGSQKRAALSFLFHTRGEGGDWHRWSSRDFFTMGDGWHHVVLTYEFGKPKSIRGYIDGKPTPGKWDKGGETDQPPYLSDDPVWLGTSMQQAPASSFRGDMDEVAIYRQALSAEQIKSHFAMVLPEIAVNWDGVTEEDVTVRLFENIHNEKSWQFRRADLSDTFRTPWLAFPGIPYKYNDRGVIADRSNPFLMRALTRLHIPEGKHKLLVRARNGSRLFLDGQQVAETKFHSISSSAHGKVFEVDRTFDEHVRPLHRGDKQAVVEVEGDGKLHNLRFEMIVGGRGHRHDLGETSIAIAKADGKDNFEIICCNENTTFPLTDRGWRELRNGNRDFLTTANAKRRRLASVEEDEYWQERHSLARKILQETNAPAVPAATEGMRANNAIDHFVNAELTATELTQSAPLTDLMFLRKLSLDTVGTAPTLQQIETFLADSSAERRSLAIDRFLAFPGRADNWVGYWQDVLAENPNIIKPTLNNTGPFRTWIHESFYDNKPFDRFATELVRMEGSQDYGGPAGFAKATQNDAPMAAKAYVLGQAFLGVNLKCARCHDAPAHDYLQRDLFNVAAMLKRAPLKVPASSSIPGFDFENNSLIVEVTLKPGEVVEPVWPFDSLVERIAHNDGDSRAALAELIVSPDNPRFSKVIVNRLWKLHLGMGFSEPVDDWNGQAVLLPELLDYLAYQFVDNGYDLQALERMIFASDLYQRRAVVDWHTATVAGSKFRFESPVLRQMRAEQIVDSMFAACGKDFNAGQITLDIDGAMNPSTGFDLGFPQRAWEFTSLSNERDRPSLSLPFAQPFVSFLQTFGWRDTRQDPITERERESTAGRPAVVQNGLLSRRFVRCSDDSTFTRLALAEQSIGELVDAIALTILSRKPTAAEETLFTELLEPGYNSRLVSEASEKEPARLPRTMVSWSNHLSSRANEIKVELQDAVERGDLPTERLVPDWRERYEDMLWALLNSPEFLFIP